ncbi:hypothetical protein LguiB_016037 [Lonicera macranthoides]
MNNITSVEFLIHKYVARNGEAVGNGEETVRFDDSVEMGAVEMSSEREELVEMERDGLSPSELVEMGAQLHLIYLRSRPDHPSVSRAPGLELLSRYRETSALAEFSTNGLSVSGWSLLRRRYFIKFPVTNAVEADGIQIEISNDFVSVTHLLVGVAYCLISWAAGLPNVLLGAILQCGCISVCFRPADFPVLVAIIGPCRYRCINGITKGTLFQLAWFVSTMLSNIASAYGSIYVWKAMTAMDNTNLYAYISIMSLLISTPHALFIEGPQLMQYGFRDAIVKVGLSKFLSDLFLVGMFFHLYNQIAANTLERVTPLPHVVGNVLKLSICDWFIYCGIHSLNNEITSKWLQNLAGNRISTQTGISTAIAIAGIAIYSFINANIEERKKKAAERPKI